MNSRTSTPASATTPPSSTDVLIVGAGPTGLVAAATLAMRRVPFVLVDQLAEGMNTSRACVVHARTLEVLEELDLVDRLRSRGHVVPRFTIRDRDHLLADIRFDALPTRFPYTLMVTQDVTEALLLQRLRELGGDVHRPWSAEDLRQDADGVVVSLKGAQGQRTDIRAGYVLGADGMHSVVRSRAGIGFPGGPYDASFLLADIRMSWPLSDEEVVLFFAPQGLVVVAPLSDHRYRVVATLDGAPRHPGIDDVQRILDERGPTLDPPRVTEVLWGSHFHVHRRVADRYRAGRVLIAGDAAHVHSPAGGQGMNTGIQDAVVLGHALANVLAERAQPSALDDYERRRRPVAQQVVALTDRVTRAATLHSHRLRQVRNVLIRLVGAIPGMRTRFAYDLAELRYR